ncbi:MAG TPA: histidine kinase [Gaiellaceae bacterium]|nr:histidine kinase [Gaiellaceae bacterium]
MVVDWLQRHPRIVDWALVVVALATTVGAVSRHDRQSLGVPLALVACLALLVRRRNPLAVLAITTGATFAIFAIWGYSNPFPAGVALFTVADQCERRVSLTAGAVAIFVLAFPYGHTSEWPGALSRLVGFSLAWVIGDSIRVRRRYIAALEERAERLERERAAEAARAAAEEQARIARELHDVLAHNVSVMVVQAAAANDVFDSQPERAREALQSIETTGRDALAELRRLLGIVRGDGPGYAPQPSLDRLDELVDHVRSSGLDVAITIEGEPRELPAGIDLSAYRVVQEALTNTLKHARASRAEVSLRFRPNGLDVDVRDDGVGAGNGDGAGSGLIGMRERVAVYGGSFTAGPDPGGGFAVSARFPVEAAL